MKRTPLLETPETRALRDAHEATRLAWNRAKADEIIAAIPEPRLLLEPLRAGRSRKGWLCADDVAAFLDGVRWTLASLPATVDPRLVDGWIQPPAKRCDGNECDHVHLSLGVANVGRGRPRETDPGYPWCGIGRPPNVGHALVLLADADGKGRRIPDDTTDGRAPRRQPKPTKEQIANARKLATWWETITNDLRTAGWAARGGIWRPPPDPQRPAAGEPTP